MSGQNQSIITLTSQLINPSASAPSARQRQLPMCTDCEKSLPNQIVFDKIESIIRMMQDEQNGLPVKTAKSFMSKIPSVFTGIDLIQWMMRNLKLEDQQEAIHLANLIASHGYIFPIEDHTLSIKNDCTFYRFQTPYLWPSKTADPENTDYAVYLCKRTMQGKTRLELADYEAENLARLQKMFSRKWEFIFMQAESQAKVDKKRDKLERKVLDSQERAFWDVYRPVPGCVNTTELDIKKACRLSKSAKRCSECQKVVTARPATATTTTTTTTTNSTTAITPVSSPSPGPGLTFAQPVAAPSPTPASSCQPVASSSTSESAAPKVAEPEPPEAAQFKRQEMGPAAPEEAQGQAAAAAAFALSDSDKSGPAQAADEQPSGKEDQQPDGGQTTKESLRADPEKCSSSIKQPPQSQAQSQQQQQQKQVKHHHHHQHPHHHHHHHHHHPHPHPHPHQHSQHGHHHHHHHHRQCPHHKQHQQTLGSREPQQLAIPAESILTSTLADASSSSSSTLVASAQQVSSSAERAATSQMDDSENTKLQSEGGPKIKQRASAEQFMRTPSVQVAMMGCRRKSECNRMLSVAEVTAPPTATGANERPSSSQAASSCKLGPSEARPASACCSLASFDKQPDQQQTTPEVGAGGDAAAAAAAHHHHHQQQQHQRQPLRKSSLNVGGRSATTTIDQTGADQSASGSASRMATLQGSQRSPLKSTRSVCATSSSSVQAQTKGADAASSGQSIDGTAAPGSSSMMMMMATSASDRQNIGELERELEALKVRLVGRIGGVKMSKVTQSYLSYFKQWAEYDPCIAQPVPSNPWISDSTELWDSERQTKDVNGRRVRRWAFSLKELLNDPAGREQFHRFLEKEFSAENLKFWDAVQELKRVHSKDVARRVEAIWQEYLAQDANCPINIDSKSYETSKKNMAKNKNNRYIFDEAAGHVYQLMKNDSYPRYLRSEMYKDYKEASEKKRSNQVAFDVFKPQMLMKHKFNF